MAKKLERAWEPLAPEDLATRCSSVLRLSPRERPLKVRNKPALRHPDIITDLVRQSYELRHVNSLKSVGIAQAAVDAAENLVLPTKLAHFLPHFKAQSWGNLANSFRLVDDHAAAEEAWSRVDEQVLVASLDPELLADLDFKRSALRQDQRRFGDAATLCKSAAARNQRCGNSHAAGRCWLGLAINEFYSGNTREALAEASRAADLLDGRKEPEMIVALWHNSLLFYEDDGQPETALLLLPRLDPWYEEMKAPLLTLRARWMRSRLHLAVGEPRAAVHYGETARQGLLRHGQLYDAALCGFDLALAWMHQGGHLPAQRLALEMYGVFTAKEIPRETAATLLLFADAARNCTLTLEKMRRLAEELKPLRRPGARGSGTDDTSSAPAPAERE